jgi:hypothetical protein
LEEGYQILKAIVILSNEKTTEIGSIVAIARAMARKREECQDNPPIRALRLLPEIGVYVAVYEAVDKTKHEQKSTGWK